MTTFDGDNVKADDIEGERVRSEWVQAEDLDIGGADFVATGDVHPVFSANTTGKTNISTASSTFKTNADLLSFVIPSADSLSPNGDLMVKLSCRITPGTDETATIRMQNFRDKEAYGPELSATASGQYATGWVAYTPTTTSEPTLLQVEIKTDPAVNSSNFDRASMAVGVQL